MTRERSILNPRYISLDYIKYKDDSYYPLIEKYGLKTFADLNQEIITCNPDILKNHKLLYENYKAQNYIDIPLEYISTEGLYHKGHVDAELLLIINGVTNFKEIDEKIKEGNSQFALNDYLVRALKHVKSSIKHSEKLHQKHENKVRIRH